MEWARTNAVRAIVVGLLVAYLASLVSEGAWSMVPWFAALLVVNLVFWGMYPRTPRNDGPVGPLFVAEELDLLRDLDADLDADLDSAALPRHTEVAATSSP